jgi:hypothetical protein
MFTEEATSFTAAYLLFEQANQVKSQNSIYYDLKTQILESQKTHIQLLLAVTGSGFSFSLFQHL